MLTDPQNNDDIALYDTGRAAFIPLPGLNSYDCQDESPTISADGRFSDRPGWGEEDIYLYDRTRLELVDPPSVNSDDVDQYPDISPEGRFIGFQST